MLLTLVCAALLGCGGSSDKPPAAAQSTPVAEATAAPARKVDRFNADRAWRMLEYQVKLGPRPAGSAQSRKLAAYIKARLPRARYERVPGGLRNVVGSIPGKGKAIVVAAHYDTKDIPDFVGANDGAGGTAALLELARGLQRAKRPRGAPPIWFVAFDGEEATDDHDFLGTGVRGAKAFARKHAAKVRELILLDFVADKDLAIPYEQNSDRELWDALRAAAAKVGSARAFPDREQGAVQDDHIPFVERGIPAIDLIDFDFPCWHQPCDDLDAVSKASLDRSGEAVYELVLMRSRGT